MDRLAELDEAIAAEDARLRKLGEQAAVMRFGAWTYRTFSAQNPMRKRVLAFLAKEFGLRGKWCSECQKWKPKADFSIYRKSTDGRLWRCRGCDAAYKNKWYHALPKEKKKRWYNGGKGRNGRKSAETL